MTPIILITLGPDPRMPLPEVQPDEAVFQAKRQYVKHGMQRWKDDSAKSAEMLGKPSRRFVAAIPQPSAGGATECSPGLQAGVW